MLCNAYTIRSNISNTFAALALPSRMSRKYVHVAGANGELLLCYTVVVQDVYVQCGPFLCTGRIPVVVISAQSADSSGWDVAGASGTRTATDAPLSLAGAPKTRRAYDNRGGRRCKKKQKVLFLTIQWRLHQVLQEGARRTCRLNMHPMQPGQRQRSEQEREIQDTFVAVTAD